MTAPTIVIAFRCVLQTIAWYLLFLIGTVRLAFRRFNRIVTTELECDDQEYEVDEVVACSDKNWVHVTSKFCELLEKGGGAVCTPGNELAQSMNLDIITEAEGGPISLAVTYAHRGEEFVVTYSLADSTPVTFPPTKPIADSSENRAVTKLSVLSASFGSWFSSEDNADVTDIITWLLGPERDFYAAAGIRQYVWCIVQYLRTQGRSATGQADPIGTIMDDAGADDDVHSVYSDTDLEIKAPTAPIVYKGTALLNLLADKKWPLSTNVACWWCCHTFTNIPCPLPVAYKDGKGFLVKGCFCSFNCAKAYNSREGGVSRELTNSHLFLMTQRLWYKSHKGVPFPGVVTAPARACLKMFGGYMDIDQFRAASHTHIHMTREPPYPMEVIQQVDCANAISKQRYALTQSASVKNSAVTDEKASRKATELDNRKRTRQEGVLSLKRAKPMVSKGCSLDKFVNIKAKSNQK
eukprot:jgi/Mesvir1/8500/Mv12263-RA.1